MLWSGKLKESHGDLRTRDYETAIVTRGITIEAVSWAEPKENRDWWIVLWLSLLVSGFNYNGSTE